MDVKTRAGIIPMKSARRLMTVITAFAALLITGVVSAAPQIQTWNTSNGARVFFVPAPELPMVDIRIVFDAGSAKDAGKDGVAQLTNSLMGEGAGEFNADQIAERFEGVGAQFGNDAQRDMAILSLRSLTEPSLLEPALATLATVLTQASFPADALERERSRMLVALQSEKESPSDIASKAFFAALYPDHPYGTPTLGTEESLKALAREDVQGFYREHYVARNATVAVVGALDRKAAERIVARLLADLPAGEAAAAVPPAPAPGASEPQRINYPSEQTHILLGQPGITRDDPDYFPLYVGNHILGGSGLVSRISDEVREKRGLSYSSYSYFIPMRAAGPYTAGLQTRNNQAEQALTVLRDVMKDFIEKGPTDKELSAAKKNITGGFALRLDSNSKIVDNLAMIGFYRLPLDYLDRFNDRVEAVTVGQIRDAFQRRVHPQRMVTVIVGGGASAPAP